MSLKNKPIGYGFLLIFLFVANIFAPSAALAYPPGTLIGISLSSNMVKSSSHVTALITNAKPGLVRVTVNNKTSSKVANSLGKASVEVDAPAQSGIYTVNVSDGALSYNSNSTKLYLPYVSIPSSAPVGKNTYATVLYARPGAIVSIKIGSKTYSGTVGSNSTAVVAFKVPVKNSNNLSISVGLLSYGGLKITGK